MTKQIQLRGNCQRCGALQAVVSGHMSKHGYTVKHGWFNGVCRGEHFAPMQVSREETDRMVASVRKDVALLQADLIKMRAGKIVPKVCEGAGPLERTESGAMRRGSIPFADAPDYAKAEAVRSMIYSTEQRIRMGTSFANDMEALATAKHGTALIEVAKPEAAARIQAGERRLSAGGNVLIASYQDGARVYWKNERGFGSWTGSKAWRALKAA